MKAICIILTAVISYLIGSINSSIIISKLVSGKDIRTSGSGNAGATNMLRTMGKKYAAITLVIDVLKGVVAILLSKIAQCYGVGDWIEYVAGVCAVLGHNFPVFFGFRGGKGVATSLGVVMMLEWRIGLCTLVAAIIIMATTRYVSLGSIVSAVIFMALQTGYMIWADKFDIIKFVCVMILGILLIVRHSKNIVRLINHTENKLGGKKSDDGKKEA